MQPLIPITNSSNLAGYAFDSATGVLAVQFKSSDKPHLYRDVAPATVDAFKVAPSAGKFFIANIRDHHDHEAPDGTVTPAKHQRAESAA
jgi:hypothetical protein